MLTMVHSNSARVDNGGLRVDRKFLTGMRRYAEHIDTPLVTVHPLLRPGEEPMDMVEVACSELNFAVQIVDPHAPADMVRLRDLIGRSELVVGGDLGADLIARRLGIPYILVLEYDLNTQMTVTASQVTSPLRKLVRRARCATNFYVNSVPAMRGAIALHCNGFPVYDEAARYNDQRVLYLDSRMSADLVIPLDRLQQRLAGRSGRRARLLFSGRYDPMKGAADSVRVALDCLRRGLDVELHCYGQGSQQGEMRALAARPEAAGNIHVHEAIPYPELVARSAEFDLFVCCHVQSDPSCTYLESFGAGLPIVGYANRMWQRLADVSGCGRASPLGRPAAVADSIEELLADSASFDDLSLRAREFAVAHSFEREFTLRTRAIQQTLDASRRSREAPRPA